MTIVISYGGSIIAPEKINPEFIEKLTSVIPSGGEKTYLVVGGGEIARKYICLGRELGANESLLDEMGILATRMNAYLLLSAIGKDVYPRVAGSIDEAMISNNMVTLMGGTIPGHTTDAVAAILAERIGADRLLIATSVDGIYTSDPRIDEGAKKLDRLGPEEAVRISLKNSAAAGSKSVIDLLAARIIERSSMECWVFDGRDVKELENAIRGDIKHFGGSVIA